MRNDSIAVAAVITLIFSSAGWGADFESGQDAFSAGDYETALAAWQPIAEEGNAEGQFGMGLLYTNGFGVPFDNDQGLKWYQLSADQGHGQAQCNLAVMHANGWGVPQSDVEAFKYYSLSADQGITQAQTSLAKMYVRGYGTPVDKKEAYKWYSIASEMGDTGASFKLEEVAEKMSAEEIAASDQLAATWMESHPNMFANE
jgi:TPR repeat protein